MLHCIVHSYQFRQAKIIRKTDILYKWQSDEIKVENVSKKFNGVIGAGIIGSAQLDISTKYV